MLNPGKGTRVCKRFFCDAIFEKKFFLAFWQHFLLKYEVLFLCNWCHGFETITFLKLFEFHYKTVVVMGGEHFSDVQVNGFHYGFLNHWHTIQVLFEILILIWLVKKCAP